MINIVNSLDLSDEGICQKPLSASSLENTAHQKNTGDRVCLPLDTSIERFKIHTNADIMGAFRHDHHSGAPGGWVCNFRDHT